MHLPPEIADSLVALVWILVPIFFVGLPFEIADWLERRKRERDE